MAPLQVNLGQPLAPFRKVVNGQYGLFSCLHHIQQLMIVHIHQNATQHINNEVLTSGAGICSLYLD